MDNYTIADQLSLLAKLMEIHGENSFKAKSYSSAAFTIEKLPKPLADLAPEKIFSIKGIGESVGNKIIELLQNGELQVLQEVIQQTPEGVLEMMNIKGLGPKKIHTLWKEMQIETIEELEQACRENRIAQKKGFGEKTEQKILESIKFVQKSKGQLLYKHVEDFVSAFQQKLQTRFPQNQHHITGAFRRQMEVIGKLEWVTTVTKEELKKFLLKEDIQVTTDNDFLLAIQLEEGLQIHFHLADEKSFAQMLFETSASEEFLEAWSAVNKTDHAISEEAIFEAANINFIPAYLRESSNTIERAKKESFSNIIQTSDIKGLIHSHSNWSDGAYTIEAMAEELIRLGFEYLVISDHSKAAYYANGLSEQKIKEQHNHIDTLNKKFHPFKIFKSIECDILADGSLDYENKILASFDLVITSIHSNLDMDEEKAMQRLLGAIANPYTTILGHMTGRLLLKRKGYPVHHQTIIDACADNNVVIEINASPSRLDMDWRWIEYALEKNVLLSINPDAHSLDEFPNVKYGTLVAQKGALPASRNLSSFGLEEFENFLQETRRKKSLDK